MRRTHGYGAYAMLGSTMCVLCQQGNMTRLPERGLHLRDLTR